MIVGGFRTKSSRSTSQRRQGKHSTGGRYPKARSWGTVGGSRVGGLVVSGEEEDCGE